MSATPPLPTAAQHLRALREPLAALEAETGRIESWGRHLAGVLLAGGRLLAAGNGGSAAQAQHLTAELVGRYRDDRIPLSAIALHADTSSLTAIANDYGAEALFARQTLAHGRSGDVLVALSTSGCSGNVLAAVRAARDHGLTTWGLTGPAGNPLADSCDDAVCIPAPATATVQELHLVVVHLLCAAVDVELARLAVPAHVMPGLGAPGSAATGSSASKPTVNGSAAPALAAPALAAPALAAPALAAPGRAAPGRAGRGWEASGLSGHELDGAGLSGSGLGAPTREAPSANGAGTSGGRRQ